ncbi:MAG: NAD-dependent epimerase/dehydratase family protein [Desulfamplus sp.]|nr:NAD-dependent epimerase/dehydratase family protein [Desulfamplus sp.]
MQPQGILILGGTGFVGRQLINRLQSFNLEIYVIARSAHLLPKLPNIEYYRDSLDNITLLNKLLPRCKTVFHLASDSTPGSSASQPTFEISNNLFPTLRFLEVLQQYDQVHLIYVSSGGAVYGNPNTDLVNEDTPLTPLSYYGAGKAALEKFIIAFAQQTQCFATILRPSNFYGPEQPYRTGFGIVSTIFEYLRANKPLSIWGDGENVRDYLYISDFIDLCVKLIEQPICSATTQIYNVGSGQGTTLNQLCELIEKVTQLPVTRKYQPSRSVDVRRIVLDCTKVHNHYQWSPKTNLPKGLELTWQWFNTFTH